MPLPKPVWDPTNFEKKVVPVIDAIKRELAKQGGVVGSTQTISINTDELESAGIKLDRELIALIKAAYKKVGWNVEYYSDQREGCWLSFS